jgi:hypothetical protein
MRNIFRRTLRQWSPGWILPLALLALPRCSSFSSGGDVSFTADRGASLLSSAVFCDIQQPPGRRCANATDKALGIRLESAAIELATGQKSTIGLDESPDARGRCGGEPEAVLFQGQFPDGQPVCLNCSRIGAPPLPYADASALCVALCKDLFKSSGQPGDPALFCTGERAHVSTNFVPAGGACFDGVCLDVGTPRADFLDPRRAPEPVTWGDLIGVGVTGTTLFRTTPTPGPGVFDAGAASVQVIGSGDAYVEFTAVGLDKTRLCGLTSGAPPDTNPGFDSIEFAVDLFKDGHVYIFEQGVKIAGPDTDPAHLNSFGTYQNGEKYRITLKNNFDGSAKVTYSRLTGSCTDGSVCPEQPLFTSSRPAHYPIRVDSSFHDQGATLNNVRLVRIR